MGGVGWVERVGGVRKGEIIAPKRIVKVTSTSARPLPHFLPPSFPPPSHTPLVTPNRGFTATCKDHQPARHQPVLPPLWPTPLLRHCSPKPRPERHRLLISGTEQRGPCRFSLGSIHQRHGSVAQVSSVLLPPQGESQGLVVFSLAERWTGIRQKKADDAAARVLLAGNTCSLQVCVRRGVSG